MAFFYLGKCVYRNFAVAFNCPVDQRGYLIGGKLNYYVLFLLECFFLTYKDGNNFPYMPYLHATF